MQTRLIVALGLLAFVALAPGIARADCRTSASGAFSIDVSLSPTAGRGCFSAVQVFASATCTSPARWSITLHCSETRRMVVSDQGRLVTLLADRGSQPRWAIVRVFERQDERAVVRSVRLEELAIEPRIALTLDAHALRAQSTPVRVISIVELELLGRRTGTRRIHTPRADPSDQIGQP